MLESLLRRLLDAQVDVITCWSNVIDMNSNTKVGIFNWVCEGGIQEKLINGTAYVDTNGALIRREKLEQIGGWSEDCPSFQEWDLHLRLSQVAIYSTVKEPLVEYYVNGEDSISKNRHREIEGYFYILEKHRNLWIQYPEPYLQYCNRVLSIIHSIKDYQNLHRLFLLCPSLRKVQAREQLKTLYNKLLCRNK